MKKRNLFLRAWSIAKQNRVSMKQALTESWKAESIRERMANEIVEFSFRKKDGSIRYAEGTTMNFEPTSEARTVKQKTLKQNGVITFFDVQAQGIRCFKAESLIQILN